MLRATFSLGYIYKKKMRSIIITIDNKYPLAYFVIICLLRISNKCFLSALKTLGDRITDYHRLKYQDELEVSRLWGFL